MNIIILAGNSHENYTWAQKIKATLGNFAKITIQDYDHWKSSNKFINKPEEKKKLIEIASGLENYVILAKSIGVILAIQSIYEQNNW